MFLCSLPFSEVLLWPLLHLYSIVPQHLWYVLAFSVSSARMKGLSQAI